MREPSSRFYNAKEIATGRPCKPGLIKDGVIQGGMIPKIDCAVEAVRSGVNSAVILDGRIPHSILIELLSDKGLGTMLTL